jgi:hypothetical protein
MSDTPDGPLIQAPDGTLSEDTLCIRCGYNLRGLTPDKVCPECFTPIAGSLHGNMLAFADADWLKRLHKGTVLKLWSIALGIVGGIVGVIITLRLRATPELMVLFSLPAGLLGLWAAFLITAQEPRIAIEEDPITLRKVVRACAVLGVIRQLIGQGGTNLSGLLPAPLLIVLTATLGAVTLVGVAAEFVYFRRFARRMPDDKLARSTTIVMWGFMVSLVLVTIGAIADWATGALSGAAAPGGVGVIATFAPLCVGSVGLLLFGLGYVVLLTSYKNAFAKAVAGSRELAVDGQPLAQGLDARPPGI